MYVIYILHINLGYPIYSPPPHPHHRHLYCTVSKPSSLRYCIQTTRLPTANGSLSGGGSRRHLALSLDSLDSDGIRSTLINQGGRILEVGLLRLIIAVARLHAVHLNGGGDGGPGSVGIVVCILVASSRDGGAASFCAGAKGVGAGRGVAVGRAARFGCFGDLGNQTGHGHFDIKFHDISEGMELHVSK